MIDEHTEIAFPGMVTPPVKGGRSDEELFHVYFPRFCHLPKTEMEPHPMNQNIMISHGECPTVTDIGQLSFILRSYKASLSGEIGEANWGIPCILLQDTFKTNKKVWLELLLLMSVNIKTHIHNAELFYYEMLSSI